MEDLDGIRDLPPSAIYSFCGYKNLFHYRHPKRYDSQYWMCASIVRQLRCCPYTDRDYEDMIVTISCNEIFVFWVSVSI